MAIKKGSDYYTMFQFRENGKVFNRRIHRMELQDRLGKLHIVDGKLLPDTLSVDCGHSHSGNHVATLLLKPQWAVLNRGPIPMATILLSAAFGFWLGEALEFVFWVLERTL